MSSASEARKISPENSYAGKRAYCPIGDRPWLSLSSLSIAEDLGPDEWPVRVLGTKNDLKRDVRSMLMGTYGSTKASVGPRYLVKSWWAWLLDSLFVVVTVSLARSKVA